MMSDKKTARLAGLIYLGVVLTGMFSLAYVPGRLLVEGNAESTVQNIKNGTMLFKWGIFSSVLCYLFFLVLPLVLYRLLKPVQPSLAKLMVIFAIVSVPISFMNLQHKFAILSLINGEDYLQVFPKDQLQAGIMFCLHQYDKGILMLQVFWGLWLFPLGLLIWRSGFLPKVLGVLLMAGCVGYLVNFTGHMLITAYPAANISGYVRMPASLGEIGTCLWLLIVGVRKKVTGPV